ncbi:hypothetical protein ACFLRZ_00805 [Bacteroidota bacterium]
MENNAKILQWLLQGDASIRWQVYGDLLHEKQQVIDSERIKIANEGWGAQLLSMQDQKGTWSSAIYSPKWTSTTYTLLLLKRMGLTPGNSQAVKACQLLLDKGFYHDGGINYFASMKRSETCVTGMVLALASYFGLKDNRIIQLVEHLLSQQLSDGGWNCRSFLGDTHSSFHTTITVLEGFADFMNVFTSDPLIKPLQISISKAHEFFLQHQLFKSHRTGEIANSKFTLFSFPPRWYYDVMRGLDYFRFVKTKKDLRFNDSIQLLLKKRTKEGLWKLQNKHAGKTFFEMEKTGEPSRWNTLRALRILKWWES